MKTLRNTTLIFAALSAVISLGYAEYAKACDKCGCDAGKKPNIVEIAAGNKDFKTLVAAVKAADLVETLSGKGPFTVFAPTNDAFAKLPDGTLEDLLKPENKKKLASILTYHVVPGKVMAKDVVELKEAKTVNGEKIKIKVKDGKVMINDAKVVKTDIVGSNGVIHVLDSVILPPAKEASAE